MIVLTLSFLFIFLSIFCAKLQKPGAIEDVVITAVGAAKQQIPHYS